jgi:pimeloyl-ACP methyl ester carboxylesterase
VGLIRAGRAILGLAGAVLLAGVAAAEEKDAPSAAVTFPTRDGGVVSGLLRGRGERGVVLAHGGRFRKESWEKQMPALADAGFRVLAIDFRGYGRSRGPGDADPLSAPLEEDVLAAVRFLKAKGATSVSVIGASMGADAAAAASIEAAPGEIDRLVLLAGGAYAPGEKVRGRKLYILCRDDPGSGGESRRIAIERQYDRAAAPKKLVLLEGSAHAQFIFETDQGARLLREILAFLTEP